MSENTFNSSMQKLLNGLDGFLSTKSVVGAPITVNDTTILPLVDVSMGVGAGEYAGKAQNGGTGGGLGAKMSASGVLVIRPDGSVRIVSAKNQDSLSKAIDMVPDVIDKVRSMIHKDPEVDEAAREAEESTDERVTL